MSTMTEKERREAERRRRLRAASQAFEKKLGFPGHPPARQFEPWTEEEIKDAFTENSKLGDEEGW